LAESSDRMFGRPDTRPSETLISKGRFRNGSEDQRHAIMGFSVTILKALRELSDIYLWIRKDKPASTLWRDPNANLTYALFKVTDGLGRGSS
jgi:hypothetical protein